MLMSAYAFSSETVYMENLWDDERVFLEKHQNTTSDERILDLNRIVEEVRQSEEWEAVKMNILEIGFEQGKEAGKKAGIKEGREKGIKEGIMQGAEQGSREMLIRNVEAAMKNFGVDLQKACEGLGVSVAEYEAAKRQRRQEAEG